MTTQEEKYEAVVRHIDFVKSDNVIEIHSPAHLLRYLSSYSEFNETSLALVTLEAIQATRQTFLQNIRWFKGPIKLNQDWTAEVIDGKASVLVVCNKPELTPDQYEIIAVGLAGKAEEIWWLDIIKVIGDTWWSQMCLDEKCCSQSGTKIDEPETLTNQDRFSGKTLAEILSIIAEEQDAKEIGQEESPQTD